MTRSAKIVRTRKTGLKVREVAPLSVPGSTAASPLHPRKLPRQARASATVEGILDAAAEILEKHGFDAYTTNAIAERAGASIGSLYQYFPNKTALTQALIAREDTLLLVALDALREQSDTGALLPGLIRIAVAHQLKRPVLARLLDAEEARLPPTEETQQLHAVLVAIFHRALGEELVSLEPRLFQDLFSMIQGMVDAAGQRGEQDGEALIRRVQRALDGYLEVLRRDVHTDEVDQRAD